MNIMCSLAVFIVVTYLMTAGKLMWRINIGGK